MRTAMTSPCSARAGPNAFGATGTLRAVSRTVLTPMAVARPAPRGMRQQQRTQAQGHETATVGAVSVITEAVTQAVTALTSQDFHAFLEEAGNKLVVVDFYTDWCGPCKMIAPKVEQMAQQYDDVLFAKFNCGVDNDSKRLAVALGIKALPTFHLYRQSKVQSQMTGAKIQSLQDLVDKHK